MHSKQYLNHYSCKLHKPVSKIGKLPLPTTFPKVSWWLTSEPLLTCFFLYLSTGDMAEIEAEKDHQNCQQHIGQCNVSTLIDKQTSHVQHEASPSGSTQFLWDFVLTHSFTHLINKCALNTHILWLKLSCNDKRTNRSLLKRFFVYQKRNMWP